MKLTLAEAQQVLAMDDPTAALVEASRVEYGGWSVEQAEECLIARVRLNLMVEDALDAAGLPAGEGA